MPLSKTRSADADMLLPTIALNTDAVNDDAVVSDLRDGSLAQGKVRRAAVPTDSVVQTNLSDNCREGIFLREGEAFTIHPAAARFRKLKSHRVRLRKSLEEFGQQEDAVVRITAEGTIELLDGMTRQVELFDMGQPLRCRVLQNAELEGRTIEDFIMKVNLHDGRDLNDAQRTVAAMDVYADQIEKWMSEAKERQSAGKAVDASQKIEIADILAERVNVSKGKMEKTLLLRKMASGYELLQAVWEGIPVSTALKIAHESDENRREVLIDLAVKGDKKGLKIAMTESTTKRARDRFGVSIPPSLLDTFEQTTAAENAILQAVQAAETLRGTNASSKFIDNASRLQTDVLPALAYAMCEWCEWSGSVDGVACPICKAKRYLTLSEYENARELEKKKLVVVTN